MRGNCLEAARLLVVAAPRPQDDLQAKGKFRGCRVPADLRGLQGLTQYWRSARYVAAASEVLPLQRHAAHIRQDMTCACWSLHLWTVPTHIRQQRAPDAGEHWKLLRCSGEKQCIRPQDHVVDLQGHQHVAAASNAEQWRHGRRTTSPCPWGIAAPEGLHQSRCRWKELEAASLVWLPWSRRSTRGRAVRKWQRSPCRQPRRRLFPWLCGSTVAIDRQGRGQRSSGSRSASGGRRWWGTDAAAACRTCHGSPTKSGGTEPGSGRDRAHTAFADSMSWRWQKKSARKWQRRWKCRA